VENFLHRDSIPWPSSPQRIAIPSDLSLPSLLFLKNLFIDCRNTFLCAVVLQDGMKHVDSQVGALQKFGNWTCLNIVEVVLSTLLGGGLALLNAKWL
jgi:hypothetical protein